MDRQRVSAYLGVAGLVVLVIGATVLSTGAGSARAGTVFGLVGAAALLACGVMNRRSIFAYGRSRRARYGTNALLMAVFFTAILVVVQAIAVRNNARFDLTRNQRYTLALQTLNVLDALDTDVTATAFFRRTSIQREAALDLLELYSSRNRRLTVDVVDPDRRPHIANEMGASYNEVVFRSRDHSRVVSRITEEQFTNALVQVTRGQFKTIYFVGGHGEMSITSGERTGYASAARGLTDQGYVVQPLSLLDVDEVPSDCEVLVIAGAHTRLLSTETERIDLYLRRGGSALFLIEPWIELPNVESLLRDYGLALPRAELLEQITVTDNDREFGPRWTKILRYQPHPITAGFTTATFYPSARPVQIVADENDVRFDASYLAVTSDEAWGEVDRQSFKAGTATRDGDDLAGPLPVAAVVARAFGTAPGQERVTARVAVFGDADFVNNGNYGLLGNADMFQNTIAWLAGDEDLISIRPREGVRDQIYITASQGHLIFALCVFLLPLSVVGVGISVFVRKRKA